VKLISFFNRILVLTMMFILTGCSGNENNDNIRPSTIHGSFIVLNVTESSYSSEEVSVGDRIAYNFDSVGNYTNPGYSESGQYTYTNTYVEEDIADIQFSWSEGRRRIFLNFNDYTWKELTNALAFPPPPSMSGTFSIGSGEFDSSDIGTSNGSDNYIGDNSAEFSTQSGELITDERDEYGYRLTTTGKSVNIYNHEVEITDYCHGGDKRRELFQILGNGMESRYPYLVCPYLDSYFIKANDREIPNVRRQCVEVVSQTVVNTLNNGDSAVEITLRNNCNRGVRSFYSLLGFTPESVDEYSRFNNRYIDPTCRSILPFYYAEYPRENFRGSNFVGAPNQCRLRLDPGETKTELHFFTDPESHILQGDLIHLWDCYDDGNDTDVRNYRCNPIISADIVGN